ncbi:hypothetical protein [Halalkalicoccus subterraneus]|uniref:hypothetical protein n=1 Tax=Halalkalicoccus subterraneus TaxID=2675002 RepID=UPI0013CEEC04|nr:hypothetical protein [Halalkalicoccus subterraneus]
MNKLSNGWNTTALIAAGEVGEPMAKWKCDACGTVHRRNPSKCRSCGNTVLSPYHGDGGGRLDDRRVRYGLIALAVVVAALVVIVAL